MQGVDRLHVTEKLAFLVSICWQTEDVYKKVQFLTVFSITILIWLVPKEFLISSVWAK
jgi:hypothetical protein